MGIIKKDWLSVFNFLVGQERREIEMELRKQQEEAEKAKEAKELANKKEKMRLMKEQVTQVILIGAFPGLFLDLFFLFLGTLLDYN